MTRQIRFNAFDMNCVAHQSPGLWTHPRDRSSQYKDVEYWTELAATLTTNNWRVETQPDSALHVFDATPAQIGDAAGAAGLWLHELTLVQSSLEEAFMRLTAGSVEYHSGRTDVQHALEGAEASGWGWGPEHAQPADSQPKERIQ